MNGNSRIREANPFGARLASSAHFRALFADGMRLVEETAAYLDGPGRAEAKALDRGAALNYATESMRLTTRLMQLASWLLLHRAVNEGELTLDDAAEEKSRTKLASLTAVEAPIADGMPAALIALIERSGALQNDVQHLDRVLYEAGRVPAPDNAVADHLDRLRQAFGA